ncbi:MAG: DUF4382 domain-containing protein [Planctomycetota bacterium]
MSLNKSLRRFLLAGLLGLALLTGPSCGGGGSGLAGSKAEENGTVSLVTGDAAVDGLSSVCLTVQAVQFRRPNGTLTANLLKAPRRFNFLQLQNLQALLGLVEIPRGTFLSAVISVDPATVEARDMSGAPVPVSVVSSSDEKAFEGAPSSRLKVKGGDFQTVALEVDLAGSVDSDPGGGIFFDLNFRARREMGSVDLDSFSGRVISVDRSGSFFLMELEDREDSGEDHGRFRVDVQDSDFLFDAQGTPFATARAFLAALAPGKKVDVRGTMKGNGRIDASSAGEDDDSSVVARIKGRIQSIDPAAGTFELLILEIEKGRSTVQPVLDSLGNPGVITISFTAMTPVIGEDNGAPLDSSVLKPGLKVKVRFSAFQAPMPFPAAAIEVDEVAPEFEGRISDNSGLPNSIQVTLDSDDPAVVNGLVDGPVTVDLTGLSTGSPYLDSGPKPVLNLSSLLVNLKVKIKGSLSGPPTAAAIAAASLEVEPGRLRGTVSSVQETARTFVADVTRVDDPFGGSGPGNPALVRVPANARIEGKDGPITFAQFAALFQGLGAGQMLEVRVEGIADPSADVAGYEIEAEVK